jgi:hypothetical protein
VISKEIVSMSICEASEECFGILSSAASLNILLCNILCVIKLLVWQYYMYLSSVTFNNMLHLCLLKYLWKHCDKLFLYLRSQLSFNVVHRSIILRLVGIRHKFVFLCTYFYCVFTK